MQKQNITVPHFIEFENGRMININAIQYINCLLNKVHLRGATLYISTADMEKLRKHLNII